jgi:nucleoid-associated protein YgaU
MPDPNKPLPDFSDVQGGSSSTAPQPPRPPERTYTVQKGDSLSKIAKAFYGNYPGQVFRIPQV